MSNHAPHTKAMPSSDSTPPPSPVRRRRGAQAARSEATQARILEAAARLIRQRGFDGFATEEVSQRAGVSRGAQRHHYPTKNALVTATLHHLARKTERFAVEQIEASRAEGKILDHIIADALDFFLGDYFFMTLSVVMSDERNDELRVAARNLVRQCRLDIESAWLKRLEEAGLPSQTAADMLALTLSVIRGFGVRTLILNDPERFRELTDVWRQMVRAHLSEHLTPAQREMVF